jgi:hypothetical protein
MAKRKGLTKKVRFEVFKRDSFTCQYCGKSAPDVILNADHLHPVAEGGTNEIINLVTSCFDCNSGKGSRKLDDGAIVKKQIDQMKKISERQEQLAMMAEWRSGMMNLEDAAVEAVFANINRCLAHTKWKPKDDYRNDVRTMLKRYSVEEIYSAIDACAASYLRQTEPENVNKFLSMLPRVCYWRRAEKENPLIGEINRAVGLASNRWYRVNRHTLYKTLLDYHQIHGVPIETIRANVAASSGIMAFEDLMKESING